MTKSLKTKIRFDSRNIRPGRDESQGVKGSLMSPVSHDLSLLTNSRLPTRLNEVVTAPWDSSIPQSNISSLQFLV
jgi:hypothetical protein